MLFMVLLAGFIAACIVVSLVGTTINPINTVEQKFDYIPTQDELKQQNYLCYCRTKDVPFPEIFNSEALLLSKDKVTPDNRWKLCAQQTGFSRTFCIAAMKDIYETLTIDKYVTFDSTVLKSVDSLQEWLFNFVKSSGHRKYIEYRKLGDLMLATIKPEIYEYSIEESLQNLDHFYGVEFYKQLPAYSILLKWDNYARVCNPGVCEFTAKISGAYRAFIAVGFAMACVQLGVIAFSFLFMMVYSVIIGTRGLTTTTTQAPFLDDKNGGGGTGP
jgi:hypothetical protein